MDKIYEHLIYGKGSKKVKLYSIENIEKTVNGKSSSKRTTVYKFEGDSMIQKEVMDLIKHTRRIITLSKISIVRTNTVRSMEIQVRFESKDNETLYIETDEKLLGASDETILSALSLEITEF